MPPLLRLGDLAVHGCWGTHEAISASGDTFCNGIGAVRLGDGFSVHCCDDDCHAGSAAGSGTTFINGLPAQKIGDPVSCGSTMCTGSGDTFVC